MLYFCEIKKIKQFTKNTMLELIDRAVSLLPFQFTLKPSLLPTTPTTLASAPLIYQFSFETNQDNQTKQSETCELFIRYIQISSNQFIMHASLRSLLRIHGKPAIRSISLNINEFTSKHNKSNNKQDNINMAIISRISNGLLRPLLQLPSLHITGLPSILINNILSYCTVRAFAYYIFIYRLTYYACLLFNPYSNIYYIYLNYVLMYISMLGE